MKTNWRGGTRLHGESQGFYKIDSSSCLMFKLLYFTFDNDVTQSNTGLIITDKAANNLEFC